MKRAHDGIPVQPNADPHQTDILGRLSPKTRAEFERRCSERRVSAGTILFRQGELHTNTFLIKSGLVRTYYLSPPGKEITLAFWAAGNLVGGPDFFHRVPHIWSGRAVKDSTLLVIEGAALKRLACRLPDLAECVMEALTFKVHWLSILLQTLATECVADRVAHQLVRLSDMHGHVDRRGIVIQHEFTQHDLAAMVGATRQWVSIALNQLQRAGLIRVNKRHLVIRDLEALKQFGQRSSTAPG